MIDEKNIERRIKIGQNNVAKLQAIAQQINNLQRELNDRLEFIADQGDVKPNQQFTTDANLTEIIVFKIDRHDQKAETGEGQGGSGSPEKLVEGKPARIGNRNSRRSVK